MTCKQIDPNYEVDYIWNRSAIFASHIKQGVVELLLRGNLGRHAPFPLVRSYIEVLITRSLLNTKHSNKYNNKRIVVLKSFKKDDIWRLMRELNAGTELQIFATSLLYDWGSMSVHRAVRILHSMIWYSVIFTDVLSSILASVKLEPDKLDAIIDDLVKQNKVTVL